MKHKVKHIHFVGIGGAGMSGLAEVFLNLGYRVSGSDLVDSPVIDRLRELNAAVYIGHESSQINGANAVVTSTAVKADNPEVIEAKKQKYSCRSTGINVSGIAQIARGYRDCRNAW